VRIYDDVYAPALDDALLTALAERLLSLDDELPRADGGAASRIDDEAPAQVLAEAAKNFSLTSALMGAV
jgi:hypothetical protein